jgi:hypothetical protein
MPHNRIEFDSLTRISRGRTKFFFMFALAVLIVAHLALITNVISYLREIF